MANLLVGKSQNGQTVRPRVGDALTLELPENPTSGYKWVLASLDETRLALERSEYVSESAALGSGGMERWHFRVRAAGAARIELKHLRPWQGDASLIDRFTLAVDIAD